MAHILRPTVIALSLLILGSCAAPQPSDPSAQALIESMMPEHKDVTRLTVHAKPADAKGYIAVASSLPSKLGAVSDPEDLKAINTGEVVVLDEAGAFDVTVPICQKNSAYTAAAGVTFKTGIAREAAVAQAKAIAASINSGMMK
jgi:hypothetical protein